MYIFPAQSAFLLGSSCGNECRTRAQSEDENVFPPNDTFLSKDARDDIKKVQPSTTTTTATAEAKGVESTLYTSRFPQLLTRAFI